MKIGVIADDFTGATDAASFIVAGGLNTIQVNGVPRSVNTKMRSDYQASQAIVVALKSRSCPVKEAIEDTLSACRWLRELGCDLIYFKYCSTFDSTEQGNIGPVIDALLQELDCNQTLICPALPVNGRCVYMGHLFVHEQLLSDSGMRNHPITPMKNSNLKTLIESQSSGRAGLLNRNDYGSRQLIDDKLKNLKSYKYIVCDAIDESDLEILGKLSLSFPLVTGGSGLVGAIASELSKQSPQADYEPYCPTIGQRGIIISGSCSEMTNKQVAAYKQHAPTFKLNISDCIENTKYVEQVTKWVISIVSDKNYKPTWFPLVYASVLPEELRQIQSKYGYQASIAVEQLFSNLVKKLMDYDFKVIISAGGETSGTVVKALGTDSFEIGQSISPGVPWVCSLQDQSALALKSGNFGDERFFFKAQEMMK